MLTIGFAGTAKNTGKTTTALEVLHQADAAGWHTGLTSIGFDGESRDHVTRLPKPRYSVQAGTLIATAEPCLKGGASTRILQSTPILTSLGRIVIAEVISPGEVLLAGPNRRTDVELVKIAFKELDVNFCLLDGALNRLVPLAAADGLVFSTGAAFTSDIPQLAAHAQALLQLLHLSRDDTPISKNICLQLTDGEFVELNSSSLLSAETMAELAKSSSNRPIQRLSIPGACRPDMLKTILADHLGQFEGCQVQFYNPLALIASGDPLCWLSVLKYMEQIGGFLGCYTTVNLRFFTVNPFYPCYLNHSSAYEPAFVNPSVLLTTMRQAMPSVRVFDLHQGDPPNLLDYLEPHFL